MSLRHKFAKIRTVLGHQNFVTLKLGASLFRLRAALPLFSPAHTFAIPPRDVFFQ
jgi:hypothetical protein